LFTYIIYNNQEYDTNEKTFYHQKNSPVTKNLRLLLVNSKYVF